MARKKRNQLSWEKSTKTKIIRKSNTNLDISEVRQVVQVAQLHENNNNSKSIQEQQQQFMSMKQVSHKDNEQHQEQEIQIDNLQLLGQKPEDIEIALAANLQNLYYNQSQQKYRSTQEQIQINDKQTANLQTKKLEIQLLNARFYERYHEMAQICDYIHQNQQEQKPLCIIGSPGTGKTSLILHILKQNNLAHSTIMVNALQFEKNLQQKQIENILQQQFSKCHHPKLFIIDQFDYLPSPYKFLSISIQLHPHTKIILICNNTHPNLQQNFQALYLMPYNFQQLQAIIRKKLGRFRKYFNDEILRFIGKRVVFHRNGDFREFVKVIIQAFENSQRRVYGDSISYEDVQNLLKIQSPIVEYLMSLSLQEIKIWRKMLELQKLQNLSKDTNRCICKKCHPIFQHLCSRPMQQHFNLNQWQIGLCLKNWQNMGLLHFTVLTCRTHHCKITKIKISNKKIIQETLQTYSYFNIQTEQHEHK